MAEKKVVTPEYWKDKYFQPLVQTQTLYGNPVKIPERFISSWEWEKTIMQEAAERWPAEVDFLTCMKGLLEGTIERRGWQAADFARVMLEIYVEEGRKPPIPQAED